MAQEYLIDQILSMHGKKGKGAARIVFGKPVYHSDVVIESRERFKAFVDGLSELCLCGIVIGKE